MKKVVLNYLVIVGLLVSAVFTSCKKDDDDKVQLLRTIIYSKGYYDEFEYDNQNRITKILGHSGNYHIQKSLIYDGNDLVKIELIGELFDYIEYVKTENQIIFTFVEFDGRNSTPKTIIDLNSDEYPIRHEYSFEIITHQYQDGNMTNLTNTWTTITQGENVNYTEYKYDNKKSGFYHCKTPKWFMFYFYGVLASQNNMIEEYRYSTSTDHREFKCEYKYEFNKAGYPTKRIDIIKLEDGSESVHNTFEFKYK